MTYLEIYQIAKRLVPAELREKYGHLAYGELADVAENIFIFIFFYLILGTWQTAQGRTLAPWRPPRAHHHLLFRGDPGTILSSLIAPQFETQRSKTGQQHHESFRFRDGSQISA